MDTIIAIFTQLGVNSTVLSQFIIVVVVFFTAKFLFLNQLQFVLENRDEKTTKLEKNADKTLERVSKLSKEYKDKIDQANTESMKFFQLKKSDVIERHAVLIKESEREIHAFIEESKMEFLGQLNSHESELEKSLDGLSDALINKIVN